MGKNVKRAFVLFILVIALCFCGCDPNDKWSYQYTKTNVNEVESIQLLQYCGEDGTAPDSEDSVAIRGRYYKEMESLDTAKHEEFIYDLSKYSVLATVETDEEKSKLPLQYTLRIEYVDGSSFYWFWGIELYTYENKLYSTKHTSYLFNAEIMETSSGGVCVLQKSCSYQDYYALVICNYFSTELIGKKELEEANDALINS